MNYYSLFHKNCVLNIDLFNGYASVYSQQLLPMKKIIKCGVQETCNKFLAYKAEARKKNINGPGIVSWFPANGGTKNETSPPTFYSLTS